MTWPLTETQAKIFAGILCELAFVFTMLGCVAIGRPLPIDDLIALGSIVLAFNGVTTWQYRIGQRADVDKTVAQNPAPAQISTGPVETIEVTRDPASDAPKVEGPPLATQRSLTPPTRVLTKDD